MPDIAKINAVAIADIEKVDGILAANIEKVNGLTFPSAAGFLLDTYSNAEAAFSVRRLYSLYTGACMRVRRDSDNVEADVGFDASDEFSLTSPISATSNGLSYTDFADFIGHGGTPANGLVRYWYDQSQSGGTGSGNDAGVAGGVRQPKIYDSSTGIIEEGSVGFEKPALNFDGTNHLLYPWTSGTNIYYSFFTVRQFANSAGLGIGAQSEASYIADVYQNNSAYTLQFGWNGSSPNDPTNTDYLLYRKDGAAAFTSLTTRAQYGAAFYTGNQNLMGFLTDGSPNSTTSTQIIIGSYTGPALFVTGNIQEFIMFQSTTSNESSNATGIETDINGHFNIY
jgi:hypothetical protein